MTTEVDEFEAAFAEAVKEEAPAPVVEEPAKEPVKDAASAPTEAGGPAKEPVKEKTAEEIAAEEKATKDAADAAKAAEDLAARIKVEAEARVSAETTARTAAEKQAKDDADAAAAVKTAKEAAEAKLKPYEPTEEEKAAMATFEKEFPNEYKAMQARLKQENKALSGEIFQAVQGAFKDLDARMDAKINERLAPVEGDRHEAAIAAAHKDYVEVVGLLPDWIAKQPGFVRKRYQEVYDGGSAAEVIEMMTTFKKDTGRTEAAPPKEEKPAPKKPSAEEIASGAPVGTKRVAPCERGAPDKNDFDGAFDEANAK